MHRPSGYDPRTRAFASLLAAGALAASGSVAMAQSTAPAPSGALPPPTRSSMRGRASRRREHVQQRRRRPVGRPAVHAAGHVRQTRGDELPAPDGHHRADLGRPWPIVIYLAGGPTEQANDRFDLGVSPFAQALAGQGAMVIVPAWREAAWEGGGWPTSFQDVACAIGVARAIGPAYGGDPDSVTLGGHSTGGWPPAVLALTPTPFTPEPGECDETAGSVRPDAVVMSDGNLDEVHRPERRGVLRRELLRRRPRRRSPDEWAAGDPFALVQRYPAGPDAIPSLLIYGEYDTVVSPKVTPAFHDALIAAGYDSRLLDDPRRRPHGSPGQEGDHRRDHGDSDGKVGPRAPRCYRVGSPSLIRPACTSRFRMALPGASAGPGRQAADRTTDSRLWVDPGHRQQPHGSGAARS